MPGAEPYHHRGGPVGVLLCHGFTGSPQSLRPWAEHLAAEGLTVSLPLLPGHGTRWQDLRITGWTDWYGALDRELRLLHERCATVFVAGLSMGGGLALMLAARHGPAVAGVVAVNPSVRRDDPRMIALPLLKHIVPTAPSIAGDVAKEDSPETGYDRVPLHAAHALTKFWTAVQRELPRVTQPLLLYRSPDDHVVSPANAALVLARVSSRDVTERLCPRSYHVATLDHDAPEIFDGSVAFVRRLAPEAAEEPAT
ncbi:esterase [Mangrovactinospora gilvigrisea]|uniref:Esterase n=2 Tax=Mangrovactinospora gilvigrisea TaxID=1428644 RepID=A0A1J7BS20_9ACTN|nr:esterase [Mangrovactinospora gilvigrisea]